MMKWLLVLLLFGGFAQADPRSVNVNTLIHNSFGHVTFVDNHVGTASAEDMAHAFRFIINGDDRPETLQVTFRHGNVELAVDFVHQADGVYQYVGGIQALLPFIMRIQGNQTVFFKVEGSGAHARMVIGDRDVTLPRKREVRP